MRIVMKFGGSSLASAACMRRAARLIAEQRQKGDEVAVVVSAQGGTTDALVRQAEETGGGDAGREKDALLCCGEQMAMALLAMHLQALGCPAVSFCGWQAGVRTDGNHGSARILSVDAKRVRQVMEEGRAAVIAGFQGVDKEGDLTTIGRGGSDTTAVALAGALKADVCRIYTDVRGVYTADPRLVENARMHPRISYDEMLELAFLGTKVLHSRAVELARRENVRIEVRSTFQPESEGTIVSGEAGEPMPVRGIACDRKVTLVTVTGLGGSATGRLFTLLAENGVGVDVILRSPEEQAETGTVSFSLSAGEGEKALRLLSEKRRELGFSGYHVRPKLAKVSAVGTGMGAGCGSAARMLRALEEGGVEPQYVTTGDTRVSVILPDAQAKRAVRMLHEAFFPGGESR